MGASEDLFNSIPSIRFNPAAIVRRSLRMVEEKLGGTFDVVDPTNPFMMLMEGSSTLAAASMTDAETVLRKQYESMSLNDNELYLHMSDRDYLNRFASPARATISLFLAKDDIERYAEVSDVGNYRKVVIPKHTEFTAADLTFTMQYGIEMRIKPHGGWDVVFDNSEVSPFEVLTSNVVDWRFVRIFDGQQYVVFARLDIPVNQVKITSHPGSLTLSTNYKKAFMFTDQFYYARAYRTLNTGKWVEMRTTHTDQVFDPYVPTATLRVVGQSLEVSVPQIYIQNGLLENEMRIDIYTTRGKVDIDLSSLNPNAFSIVWRDLDNRLDSRYYAPLSNMTLTILADSTATGGKNVLTFDQIRDRVMTNSAGQINLPITNVQVTSFLENMGYSTVTDVDNVTNRQFLATRLLPPPVNGPVVASAGLAIETLSVTLEQLAALPTVADNGTRMTLLPSTLYTTNNGVTEIVPKVYVDMLQALPWDERVEILNTKYYTYTPFHYVLDVNNNEFETRPYYLDNPTIRDKNFITDNDTIGMSVATRRYSIERTATGYRISIQVNGDQSWKDLSDARAHCQLLFRPEGEVDFAYMNGVQIGLIDGERVYQFDITTNYDIDTKDNIALTSFAMYTDTPREHFAALNGLFYVIYAVSGVNPLEIEQSVIDLDLNVTNLPANIVGITQETLTVSLGSSLTTLWRSSRSLPSSLDYQRHLVDVPALYKQTVYERDVTGAKVWSIVGGNVVFSVLHEIGDPILDQDDQPTYEHRIGDVMLDIDGNPIVISSRKMLRQTDILTVDGMYYFADEITSSNYRETIAKLITEWTSVDIVRAQGVLLEQSQIYFYPKVTLGYVDALVLDGKEIKLRSTQSFQVTFYVSASVYRDAPLRIHLSVAARLAINEVLQQAVVSSDDIIDAARTSAGNDIIGVTVTGLGGETPYDTITMLDDAARLSIGKRVVANADGTVGVVDDVSVTFVAHALTS